LKVVLIRPHVTVDVIFARGAIHPQLIRTLIILQLTDPNNRVAGNTLTITDVFSFLQHEKHIISVSPKRGNKDKSESM